MSIIDPLPHAVIEAVRLKYKGTEPIDHRLVSYQSKWTRNAKALTASGAKAMCEYSERDTACIEEAFAADYWILFLQVQP